MDLLYTVALSLRWGVFLLYKRRVLLHLHQQLKCDKEPLNSRLGPPDYFPQTPNCPEETLTREYLQSGYRDTVDGIEEAREILLSQIQNFNKTVVFNCKELVLELPLLESLKFKAQCNLLNHLRYEWLLNLKVFK